MNQRPNRVRALFLFLLLLGACDLDSDLHSGPAPNSANEPQPQLALDLPRGYLSRLELLHQGRRYHFGPFVGYYFRPLDPRDLTRLQLLVFNENSFYTRDLPANTKLFEGEARLASLPDTGRDLPRREDPTRIHPVFFEEAPRAWLESRPAPQAQFRHFHSCYDARGAVRHGYWLRHTGSAAFTYDMGGRVAAGSPLFHRVSQGPDNDFAQIIEFDRGPGES